MVDYQLTNLRGLRFLLAGGESLSVGHVLKAVKNLRGCELVNGYGPTENTTFTCCYRVAANWSGAQSVPIGRPLKGTQVYVLDPQLQPVPIGVPGELFAGGDGLARNYVCRPQLTQEKFIPNPFGPGGSRLYRTGDLARWLPDGNLEFLGRLDEQVKIRGYRVEPGEVEATLERYPNLRKGLVIAKADRTGAKQLVAYVVASVRGALNISALREFLSSKLPPYLVPSHFVELKQLPLNANGKVDRSALPEPRLEQTDENEPSLPRNPTETSLVAMWQELLDCRAIGIHQNVFHLGCHSLLVTQAISRIAKVFGVELAVKTIFENPTIAKLAERVVEAQQAATSLETFPPIRRKARANVPDLLARLDELTDQEVEELLSDSELNAVLS